MLFLNVVADAAAFDNPSPSFMYGCEDVSNYYDSVENLEGKSLKKKLNSIISRHQSLSYREVFSNQHSLLLLLYCYVLVKSNMILDFSHLVSRFKGILDASRRV